MKRIITLMFLFVALVLQAQIPTQYEYVDVDCLGVLSDYSGIVIVQDNCTVESIIQVPPPGTPLTQSTAVSIIATDTYGNQTAMIFNVVLLDTIPPTMMLNPEWVGYTDEEVGDMYRTFYGWVQNKMVALNDRYAGTEYYVEAWDTILTTDTIKVFQNTIPIPDQMSGFWWETAPDLSMTFN